MFEFIGNVNFSIQCDLLYAVICIVRQACDRLTHHRLIVCRSKCISMRCCHKSSRPCQICLQPDIFKVTQTIVLAFFRMKNYTINFRSLSDRGWETVEADLIVAITALRLQFRFYTIFNIFFLCLDNTEGKISVCTNRQFFVVIRCFGENIIGVILALEQGIFSFIFLFIFFSAVCYCDRHRIIICDLSEAT